MAVGSGFALDEGFLQMQPTFYLSFSSLLCFTFFFFCLSWLIVKWVSFSTVLHCAGCRLRSVRSICVSDNGGSLPVALSSKKRKEKRRVTRTASQKGCDKNINNNKEMSTCCVDVTKDVFSLPFLTLNTLHLYRNDRRPRSFCEDAFLPVMRAFRRSV